MDAKPNFVISYIADLKIFESSIIVFCFPSFYDFELLRSLLFLLKLLKNH